MSLLNQGFPQPLVAPVALAVAQASARPITGAFGTGAAPADPYAANGFEPDLAADFAGTLNSGTPFFRKQGATCTLADYDFPEPNGLRTLTNASGEIVWTAHNLLSYSSDIDNASGWVAAGADATASGNTVTSTSGTGGHSWERVASEITSGIETTVAAKITPGTHSFVYILVNVAVGNYAIAVFDLSSTGVVSQTSAPGATSLISSDVTALAGGSFLCSVKVTASGTGKVFTGFAEQASGNTLLPGGRVGWQSAAAGTETYDLDLAYAYRSDLGGMDDVPESYRAAASLTKYLPTTTTARYLPRFGNHKWNGSAWVPAGVLVEREARTNYVDEYNIGNWTPNNSDSVTITENAGVGPDGNSSLAKLEITDTTDEDHLAFVAAGNGEDPSAGPVTVSVDFRDDDQRYVAIRVYMALHDWVVGVFDLQSGAKTQLSQGSGTATAESYEIEPVGSGLWRASVTLSDSANTSILNIGVMHASSATPTLDSQNGEDTYVGVAGKGYFAGFPQVEQGAKPSSRIPTNGTATARTADQPLTFAAADAPYSASGLSLAVIGDVTYADEGSPVQFEFVQRRASLSEQVQIWLDTSPEQGQVDVVHEAGGNVVPSSSSATLLAPGVSQPFALAGRFTSSAVQGAANGSAFTEAATSAMPAVSAADLDIASTNFMGNIKRVVGWSEDIAQAGIEQSSTEDNTTP